MGAAVVFGFHPGCEQPVELAQRGGVVHPGGGEVRAGRVGDLDEELFAHGAKESFDLASALGSAGRRMHQAHPEFRAGPQQPRIDERRAVIDVDPGWNPAGGQGWFECHGQPHSVFGEAEPVAGRQPEWSSRKANK